MTSTSGSEPSEAHGSVAESVHQAADTAVQVSEMVAEQASQVTREVSSVAVRLVDDVKSQVRERAEAQLSQLADGLNVLHQELRALAEGRPDEAGPLVEYAHEGADRLGELTRHIHEAGLDGVSADIKRFARRRPAVFLTSSALAGLAIGRLLRNEAAAVQGRLAKISRPLLRRPTAPRAGPAICRRVKAGGGESGTGGANWGCRIMTPPDSPSADGDSVTTSGLAPDSTGRRRPDGPAQADQFRSVPPRSY